MKDDRERNTTFPEEETQNARERVRILERLVFNGKSLLSYLPTYTSILGT